MNKVLNIKAFSEKAGVSTATVSRVFANDGKVSERTRRMVLKFAEMYRYRPNLVAKGLLDGRTQSVGVLLHKLSTSYFADIAYGIQEVMQPLNYLPIITSLRNESGKKALLRLIDHRVEAIIACVSDGDLTDEELVEIRRFNLPMVTIDSFFNRSDCDNVRCDEANCGLLAANHFIANGHKRLGVFCSANSSIYRESIRLRSFIETAKNNGIKITEDAILLAGEKNFELPDALSALGKGYAFYCFNDYDATFMYDAAETLNWRIPYELSVIGTADLNFTKFMRPALTTIRQDGVEVGRMAARIILDRLNADACEFKHVDIGVSLVERGSVSCLKKGSHK